MDLSIIIPAYNEAKRLPKTLRQIARYLQSRPDLTTEIIVVDDGSTDTTVEHVQELGLPVRIIRHPRNLGKGAAVRTGMLAAQGTWRLFSDADLSTPIEELEILERLKPRADIIIGSRRAPGASIEQHQPWWKEWLGRAGNVLIQLLLVPGIHDTRCGFKLFSAQTQPLFTLQRLNGWGFDDELLYLARRKHFRLSEVPVRWVNDAETKVKPGAYIKTLFEIFHIHFNALRGLYRL